MTDHWTESGTRPHFSGAFTALITPFRNGAVDERALRSLVEYQIEQGIDGLVPCGTTGESVTLSAVEHDRVIEIVIEQTAGRVPVIAGTGSNDTRATIERTRHARDAGASAALVVVPYYNKPSQEGMIRHFSLISESVDLPIVLYNVPGRTGVNMLPETTLRLAESANVVAVKEASGNLDQVSEIVLGAPEGFAVLSGDDSLTVPIISVGGSGVISVTANIAPKAVTEMTTAALVGDFWAARQMHHQLFDLNRAMFLDNNPTAVKTAAAIIGLCAADVRPPLTEMSPSNRTRLTEALTGFGFGLETATAAD
jgi:4-hydroxy-tetrahydrodipicolinate synthase